MELIFITGATGFIGQRLVKELDGNIRVLSRKKQPNFETVVCDLQNESVPSYALNNIDTVFHLAGFERDSNDVIGIKDLYQKVNTDAARARIEDADFAAETTQMTKSQILSQAATSMLAQANASKQNLLALLQG